MDFSDFLKQIVKNVKEEINGAGVSSMDGLCIYCAHNIGCDLMEFGIDFDRVDTVDYLINYSHQFLIVYGLDGKCYLVDPTYSQFLKRNETLVCFEKWPSEILEKSDNGKRLLNNLLVDGCSEVLESDVDLYLNSFSPNGCFDYSFRAVDFKK